MTSHKSRTAMRDEAARKYAKPSCATSCSNHSMFGFQAGWDARDKIDDEALKIAVEALKKAKNMNDNLFEKGNIKWGETFVNWKLINEGLLAVDRSLSKIRELRGENELD